MSADLIARLIEAGTPAALVAEVAMQLGAAAAERAALDQRRKADRDRQAAKRASSRDVTLGHVTSAESDDVTGQAPSPSLSPPNPQTPIPIPEGALPAHEELPLWVRIAIARATLGAIVHAAALRHWRGMPPPAGVTFDQWQGFLDHRKAKRETLTPRAYHLVCGKLAKLAEDGWPPGELIDTAVERGWVTVFAPREFTNGRDRQAGKSTEDHSNPMVRSVIAAEARRAAGGP